ncbi:hypothetical protein [Pseudotabrizicola algicola]|uniref:Uncharacterized protein n=1 Tax=Pseudotabrizicola algicola TaxID=2709381 RepID=A0A6B3RQ17_9RHOB|nr:hypothetical protein [Pseudotabrizicola algicola]NEX45209.1 hypothetical protein [Pseudotabrizicola algicola]
MTPDAVTLIATLAFACGFATALLVVLTIKTARMLRALEDAPQQDVQP